LCAGYTDPYSNHYRSEDIMPTGFTTRFTLIAVFTLTFCSAVRAQGNLDWEALWYAFQPQADTGSYAWMYGTCYYTGLAYDKFHDALYVVNPATSGTPPSATPSPKVHILDPRTGQRKTSLGRALNGQGGQLPVPLDTVQGGFSSGQFALYKIDVDDEGRIFACNLVSPVSSTNNYKLYRWNTPSSTPKLVYSGGTEMGTFRWGDAFDVVGKRTWIPTPGVWRDSVRIFTSGGVSNAAAPLNNLVDILLADTRTTPVYDYRLGIKASSSNTLLASHGLAVTGPTQYAEIWMDNNTRVTTKNNQMQTGSAFPQTYPMTLNYALSGDTITGTGFSGPIAYISMTGRSKTYLVCADGQPNFPANPSAANYHTRARLLDLSLLGQETRPFGFGDTPYLGFQNHDESGGVSNWVADVDFKLDTDSITGDTYVVLFVLMSNNGIAAFRSRAPLYLSVPVELTDFQATRAKDAAHLQWRTASETNNHGFTVERAIGTDDSWSARGFVAGSGTTTAPQAYDFSDAMNDVPFGASRISYRLRQTDCDGRFTLSPRVDLYLDDRPAAIALEQNYPNPCAPSTVISYRVFERVPVRLSIINSTGIEMVSLVNEVQEPGSYTRAADLASYPPGVYHYILDAGGHHERRSLIHVK
jgi:hypothetical protein